MFSFHHEVLNIIMPRSDEPMDITPACCCTWYSSLVGFVFLLSLYSFLLMKVSDKSYCYVELFADSVSVSNANVSAANWTIGIVAKSPNTAYKISLHTLNARLLRGGEVISKSASLSSDFFVTGGKPNVFFNKPDVLFEKVVMPEVSGDVIWDLRVEILFALDTDALYLHGFLIAVCPAIPVKFTTDPAGKVMGSLLGHMRWCDYEFRENLDSSNSIFNSLRS